MSAENLLRNGYAYDHADLTIKLEGKTYGDGVKEIKYSSKREIGKLKGTAPLARQRTRGTIEFEGSIVLYKYMFDAIVAEWGDGWMEKEFDIVIVYGNDDQPLTTDTLVKCVFAQDEASSSEGADALEVSLNLDILGILRNGKKPMKGMKF